MEICNQESDIINKGDLEHIMADLSQDNQNFTVFLEEEEYVDINQMCDSTQEMKHETSDGVDNQSNEFNVICLPCTSNADIRSSTGTHPSIVEYAGPYNFEISLANCMTYRRGSWVYSMKLKKVFIDVDKVLLVKFKLSGNCPLGLRVRALLVYTVPDHITRAVTRCTLHKFNCDPNQIAHSSPDLCLCQHYNLVGHVLTTDHANAIYEFNSESERHSVVIPLGLPQPGSDTVTVAYQFGCKTSCPGGMSRRPVSIIFTLETPVGEVLGRRSVAVKVCSCPKRDKEREESEFEKSYMAVTNIRGRRKRLTANDVKMPIASTSFSSLKRPKIEQQIECEGFEKLSSNQTNYLVQNLNVIIDQLQGAVQGLQNICNVLNSSN